MSAASARTIPVSRPRAVLSDVDGCLYDALTPLDLPFYGWLRRHLADGNRPTPFGLMTGRSVELVKVLACVLGLGDHGWPGLCELGALILEGTGPRLHLHPSIVEYGALRPRRERLELMEVLTGAFGSVAFEPSRDYTLTIVSLGAAGRPGLQRAAIEDLVKAAGYPNARVLDAGATVDIALAPVTKLDGLRFLAFEPRWAPAYGDPAQVLGIGDSENDLDVLGAVGFRGAPANAAPAVKAIADYVSPHPGTAGVRDILRHFLDWE